MPRIRPTFRSPPGLAVLLLVWLAAAVSVTHAGTAYDPLAVPSAAEPPPPLDLTVHDAARNRDLPVRVYLPATKDPTPVVLFSHGLGGNREGSAFLGRHWAARGYAAVFLQHPGSDDSVWRDKPPAEAMAAMQAAANRQNFDLRIHDVPAVLDQLGAWQKTGGHPLAGRMDLAHVGMAGHSFGAMTTQAVSGQRPPFGAAPTDARIKAAVIMSPGKPIFGGVERAFGSVAIPWLLMTGTKDVAPIGHQDMAARLAVFPALPAGSKYELVLDRAEHSVFTDRALPGDHEPRNPNHHRAILALSTAFWDAYLRGDGAARAWLDGDGPRTMLDAADRWQRK